MLKLLSSYNENIEKLVLENAPQNASYTSPETQKEILQILADKVRESIREEIDTSAKTLRDAILSMLSHYNLDIQNICGQGYDGASNMRGEFKGLQALISKECPYAYYIHYLAHHLQLALVAASKEHGEALTAYEALMSFEFVFILHLMKEVIELTDLLCQALQHRFRDLKTRQVLL
ncbi:hypothetical protein SLE2022_156340 [Rubroshorea leprosula]